MVTELIVQGLLVVTPMVLHVRLHYMESGCSIVLARDQFRLLWQVSDVIYNFNLKWYTDYTFLLRFDNVWKPYSLFSSMSQSSVYRPYSVYDAIKSTNKNILTMIPWAAPYVNRLTLGYWTELKTGITYQLWCRCGVDIDIHPCWVQMSKFCLKFEIRLKVT